MPDPDASARLAEDAARALGPEGDLVGDLDMAGFAGSTMAVLNRAMEHPVRVGAAGLRLGATMTRIAGFTLARMAGAGAEPPIAPGRDKRSTRRWPGRRAATSWAERGQRHTLHA